MSIIRYEKGSRMSGAVVNNGTIYLAGQVGDGADVAEQTANVLAEIDRLLGLCGSSKSKILSAQVFLADISTFAQMNSVWDAWVDRDNPPARATTEARLATPDYLVEIMVIAALEG